MGVYSFFEQSFTLKPTKIEVSLIPGLPDFKVTGLPDSSMKESLLRIKSALLIQGYQLPKTHQVMINLAPAFEKKKSKGLELAIACAYLWHTEQVPQFKNDIFIYGELSLSGEVKTLPELNWLDERDKYDLLTGQSEESFSRPYWGIQSLSELCQPMRNESSEAEIVQPAPQFTNRMWNAKVARKMAAIALGQHHSLLAGPAGSGKSTFTQSLYNVLPNINESESYELKRWGRYFGKSDLLQRPLIQPHHSATAQAVLGGGKPPVPGDITRAHKGLLVMDEFLEFQGTVREALREPMESGQIQISRQGHHEILPADFLLLATTNLCPCGSFVPKDMSVRCRFSIGKCRSYLERLSGPIADRFDIMEFSNTWREDYADTSEEQIYQQVQKGREFQQQQNRQKVNARMQESELLLHLEKAHMAELLPTRGHSRRRNQSILRVARTLADLDGSKSIKIPHLKEAKSMAWKPFQDIAEPSL